MAKLRIGDSAPDFELEGHGPQQTYRLADYRGSGVILAFYPGDFTPVCTTPVLLLPRRRPTTSTTSTPTCWGSRHSRSTRTSASPTGTG